MSALSTAVEVLRRAERLLSVEAQHDRLLEAHGKKLQNLADRITAVESRLETVIAEAKGAAGATASSVVTQNLVEIARSLGALEERVRALEEQTRPSRTSRGLAPQDHKPISDAV
jgi:ABC-type transporter Mla subunit MlaD